MTGARYVNVDGRKIFVNIIGAGEAIFFLHGGPGSEHRFFLPHILPLSKKYTLILYDQRGCGKSEPAPNNNYSIEEEVRVLESLRTQLNLEKMSIFGESWGSILALHYATAFPERVHKLILTATIGINARGLKVFERKLLNKISLQDKLKLMAIGRKVKKGTASEEDVLKIVDPYYVFTKDSLERIGKTTLNQTVNDIIGEDIRRNYDLTNETHKLSNIPVLVAQGSHDILPPKKINKLLLDFLPQVEMREIKDCGHWTFVEKPEEVNALVERFLR